MSDAQEHRLAVMTAWAFFGAFGVCLILSGFAEDSLIGGPFRLRHDHRRPSSRM